MHVSRWTNAGAGAFEDAQVAFETFSTFAYLQYQCMKYKHQPLSLKHVVCPHGPQPQHNRAAWVLIYKSIEQHAA